MGAETTLTIAEEVQLSVAPVFLLTAIAAFLTMMAGRLGRAVDRLRDARAGEDAALAEGLLRRIALIHWAMRCNIVAALMVCGVVVCIFLGDYLLPDLSGEITVLFIGAMVLIAAGALLVLREIGIAAARAWRDPAD